MKHYRVAMTVPSPLPSRDLEMTNDSIERRHLLVGWLAISTFISLGLVLEALHSLKAGYLLDVQNEVRRHMWTLAHAHGTLIGLMNLGLAYTISRIECVSC